MLQETKLTINEDLFLRIIVKLEMFQQQRKGQGIKSNDYDKEIQALKEEVEKIWYKMETNKDYRLFEEI